MPLGRCSGFCLIVVAMLASAEVAWAADGDWPCVQRRVAELSAAQMWARPPPDAAESRWRDDLAVASLAPTLAARRTSLDDAAAAIERFARAAGSEKSRKLTFLFAGAFELINAERRRLIAGIERYARKQQALANDINETSRILRLDNQPDPQRASLERKLQWDSRIYDERNQALSYLCESPLILEQRAFALAHEIARHLE